MRPRDPRERLEALGATGPVLDLLLVPRAEHAYQVSAFERWAQRLRAGEDPRVAAWKGRMN